MNVHKFFYCILFLPVQAQRYADGHEFDTENNRIILNGARRIHCECKKAIKSFFISVKSSFFHYDQFGKEKDFLRNKIYCITFLWWFWQIMHLALNILWESTQGLDGRTGGFMFQFRGIIENIYIIFLFLSAIKGNSLKKIFYFLVVCWNMSKEAKICNKRLWRADLKDRNWVE